MASKKLAADVLSDRILSALLEETETFKFLFIENQLFSDTPGFWCQGLDTRIFSPEFISLSLHVTYFPVILRFSQYWNNSWIDFVLFKHDLFLQIIITTY